MDNQEIRIFLYSLGQNDYLGGKKPCRTDYIVFTSLTDFLPLDPPKFVEWCQKMSALPSQQDNKDMNKVPLPDENTELGKLIKKIETEILERRTRFKTKKATSTTVKEKDTKKSTGGKTVLKTAKGARDYSTEEMALREQVFEKIRSVFRLHDVGEIQTPVFELKEVLTGKYGEDSKLIYDLKDQGGEELSLRYDLTVPFARYVAMNKIDNLMRYQIANVYRRDNPAMTRGRYREFYQCDLDIAGTYAPMIVDAKCVKIIDQVLTSLDLGPFVIKVNHRCLLDGLFGACGVPADKFRTICSAVDKLDKSPWSDVRYEMVVEKGLEPAVADRIGEYVKLSGQGDLLEKLGSDNRLQGNANIATGIADLQLLLHQLQLSDCLGNVQFDMSLARGLDYYTGLIYEAVLKEAPAEAATPTKQKKKANQEEDEQGTVGSVAAGGRYDGLVGLFASKNKSVPCVGVSFGVERLYTLYERKAKLAKVAALKRCVFVAAIGRNMTDDRTRIYCELQREGIPCQMSFKANPKFLDQVQFAENCGIPLVVGVGESELAAGEVIVRTTDEKRAETRVKRAGLVEYLKRALADMGL